MKYVKFNDIKFNSRELINLLKDNNIPFYYTNNSKLYAFDDATILDDDIMYLLLRYHGETLTSQMDIINALNDVD